MYVILTIYKLMQLLRNIAKITNKEKNVILLYVGSLSFKFKVVNNYTYR